MHGSANSSFGTVWVHLNHCDIHNIDTKYKTGYFYPFGVGDQTSHNKLSTTKKIPNHKHLPTYLHIYDQR